MSALTNPVNLDGNQVLLLRFVYRHYIDTLIIVYAVIICEFIINRPFRTDFGLYSRILIKPQPMYNPSYYLYLKVQAHS